MSMSGWGRRASSALIPLHRSTIVTILFAVGLLAGCWFIAHGAALRFFVLFIGTMSSLYSCWDM